MAESKASLHPEPRSGAAVYCAALGLLLFSNGRYPIAACAWLAPLFMLHFVRGGGLRRLLLAFLGLSATFGWQFWGMAPLEGFAYVLFSLTFGFTLLLPYVADRYLGRRWQGVTRSLVFPLAMVASECLASLNPFGTWGSIAYSQYEHLALLQIMSVTGLYGITFLIGWFASAVDAFWEAGFSIPNWRRECGAFVLCFCAALIFGGGRLALHPPQAPTVRVASITRPDENRFPYPPGANLNRRVRTGEPLTDAETEQLHHRSNLIAEFLLGRADLEAQAGAKFITFGEFNFPVLKPFEPELTQHAAELAQRRGIYIALPMAVFNIGHKPAVEDKFVMINPSGNVAWEYHKTQLPPGEAALLTSSAGKLPVIDTPYGRVGAAVAFDMDFPNFLLQAGREGADLMLVPENEYPAIDPMHSHMAVYRAIENGFNLLLHASQSLSLACDYQGRVYGLMDHYHATDRVLVAQLPTRGIRTIYTRGGFLFPWVCIGGLGLIALATFMRPVTHQKSSG